jgi:tetratricopeptide (TPR) repeat protein
MSEMLQKAGRSLLQATIIHIPQYIASIFVAIWGIALGFSAVIGLVILAKSKIKQRSLWLIPVSGVWLFLSLVPLYFEPRFYLFLCLPAAFLASFAFVENERWRRMPFSEKPTVTMVLLLTVTGVTAVQGFQHSASALKREALMQPIYNAAQVIRQTDMPGSVAARKPHIAWWSQRELTAIPQTDLAALPDSLRNRGVAFLYYGSVELKLFPQFRELLSVNGVPRGLRLVSVESGPSFGALFQVLPITSNYASVPTELQMSFAQLERDLKDRGITADVERQSSLNQYNKGMFLVTRGEFVEAIPLLLSSTRADSTFAEAFLFLGYALVETGDYARGLEALLKAEQLGQNTPELLFNRGRAHLGLGQFDEAEKAYQAYGRKATPSPLVWYHLGLIYAAKDKPVEADSLFQIAESAGLTNNPDLIAARGQVLFKLNKAEEAVHRISAGIQYAPRDTTLWLLLGYALKLQRRDEEARQAWQKVLEIDPRNEAAKTYLSDF